MKSKKLDENINRNDLVHKSNIWQINKYIYRYRKFRTTRSFGDSIFSGKIKK